MIKKTTINSICKYTALCAGMLVGKVAANLIFSPDAAKENIIIKTKKIDTNNFDNALKIQNDSTTALFQAQQNMKDLGGTLENAPFIH